MPLKSRKFSNRILVIVLLSYTLTSFYYIQSLYRTQIDSSERSTLMKLDGIAKTISTQINGTYLKLIYDRYEEVDAVRDKYADPIYREVVELLENAAQLNQLPTDVYVLTYDSLDQKFFFGPTSGKSQYYRHEYKHPPQILFDQYEVGSTVSQYEDENGTWLSAFAPIVDEKGHTIGVVQADMPFDTFIVAARKDLWRNVFINLGLILIVLILLYYWLRSLLIREENIMKQLSINNEIINKKNEDITASISYAKKIQQSLMDSENKLKSLFPSSFVLYEPKDMVSGDFYWVQSLNKERSKIAVAAADCTGHGVPGALVSVLGITYLREITASHPGIRSNEILEELNMKIIDTFSNQGKGVTSKDGMDISLCLIDFNSNSIEFAGAYRPLLLIRDGELKEIPGDKQPIGSDHFVREREFSNHNLEFKSGDWLYMFSDGYVDQFGGERHRKFMKKRFKNILKDVCSKDSDTQYKILKDELTNWMGSHEQIDDITVLGLQLT